VSARHEAAHVVRHRVFGREEELDLMRRYVASREKDPREAAKLRAKMIAHNQLLVISIARRYKSAHLELMDLVQEGNLGLLKALDNFDPEKGYKFATYATWWIRQGITRSIDDDQSDIRVPVHIRQSTQVVRSTRVYLRKKLERRPTPEEVSAFAGLTPEKIQEYERVCTPPLSLSTPTSNDDDPGELADIIEDKTVEPAPVRLLDHERMRHVDKLLRTLKPRDEKILRLRMGIGEAREHTLEEVGVVFNLTRERIRQIEMRAHDRLSARAKAHGLYHLLDHNEKKSKPPAKKVQPAPPPKRELQMETQKQPAAAAKSAPSHQEQGAGILARIRAVGGLRQGKIAPEDIRRDACVLAEGMGSTRAAAKLLEMTPSTLAKWRASEAPKAKKLPPPKMAARDPRQPPSSSPPPPRASQSKVGPTIGALNAAPSVLVGFTASMVELEGFGSILGAVEARFHQDGRLVLSRPDGAGFARGGR
jgi:RNA polymerase sigma factor (sigma-70 family)